MRRLWPFAFFLLLGLLGTGSSFGQALPKKIVFISPVGSPPPPATTSSIFSVPSGVTIGVTASPGAVSGTVYVADPNNNQVVAFAPSGTPLIFHALTCPAGVQGCFGKS